MTYKQLAEEIAKLSDEQKNMDVTVYLNEQDEYYPAEVLGIAVDDGVLDENHPVLTVE